MIKEYLNSSLLTNFLPVIKQTTFLEDKKDASLLFSKSKVNLGVVFILRRERERQTDPIHFTKINSKWIIDLSVKCKIMKFPEDAIGGNLDDLGYGDEILDTAAKAQL
jgi:hypothetical protein